MEEPQAEASYRTARSEAVRENWWFIGCIAIALAATPLLPLLPLVSPLIAMTTPLRKDRGRMVTLWVLAALLSLMVVAPWIIGIFDPVFVTEITGRA
ncbi:hypothetical protein [Promicromonospora iranensis]|uniref:Uncharacterized protein n=1 Tax=Promicromonospora iranensis TaxID=1105144 RepID=A0ABU2CRA8_9MICO|nr:hypothetical protein [Promicromonospora iranensis]MDR7383876.1 hypothetical protein [Promicromonospora iranensis]